MKSKIYFSLLAFCCLIIAKPLSAQYVKGEGPTVSQELQLEEFSGVGLAVDAHVTIKQGNTQKVVVSGQKNIIDNLEKDVKGNNWNIKFDQKTKNYETLKIEITMKSLESLSISGSGSVKTLSQFQVNGGFELAISGSGDADLKLETDDLECSISVSGNARLEGKARTLEISIAGSGNVEAYDFSVQHCSVSTAGSGNSKVQVSEELEASIVGSGDVYYNGNPKIDASVIGSGKVKKGS